MSGKAHAQTNSALAGGLRRVRRARRRVSAATPGDHIDPPCATEGIGKKRRRWANGDEGDEKGGGRDDDDASRDDIDAETERNHPCDSPTEHTPLPPEVISVAQVHNITTLAKWPHDLCSSGHHPSAKKAACAVPWELAVRHGASCIASLTAMAHAAPGCTATV